MVETEKIFSELRVIELAGVLAGPSAGLFFCELGASVIKIENPRTGGDVTRSWKLKTEDPSTNDSAYFWSVNAGKQAIQLDLTIDAHLEKLYALVKEADIVITNYKQGDDVKLKVDYDSLSKINPRVIYASINGFGDSPRSAYDLILQAESGYMYMNGELNSQPLKMPVALIDILAGHQLKEGILIALLRRFKENKGAHLSVSLFDTAVASLANQATNWLVAGHLPKASGSLHPNIAPYGELFDTRDKHQVTFAIGSNSQFRQLCEILRCRSLAADAAYSSNQHRVSNRAQLYALLYDYVKHYNFRELYEQCILHDIPIGKIRNLKEVFEMPEAQKLIRIYTSGNKNIRTVTGNSFTFHT